jgi:PAS domain S-box-containing protein
MAAKIEEAVRSRRALEVVFAHMTQGVAIASIDAAEPERVRLDDVNPAFARQSGYEPAELHAGGLERLHGPGTDVRKLSRLVRRAVSTHCAIGGRVCFARKGGQELHAELTLVPLGASGGERLLILLRDVTERDELTERLSHVERLAAVGALAAGLSHEINSPLAAVLAHVELLEEALPRLAGAIEAAAPALAADVVRLDEHLVAARHSAEQVAGAVRSLQLLVARRDPAGDDQAIHLAETVDAAIRLARPELRPRARVVRSYQPVPMVRGDAARVQQVFVQLLLHVARVLPEGDADRRQVRVSLATGPDGDAVAAITCSAPDVPLASLVEGLGPSISQTIVVAHGGRLLVHAEADGPRFEIHLPAQRCLPTRRARVLIVDDDAQLVASLCQALGDEHEVEGVASGSLALARLRAEARWDLILCDVQMDGLSGIDVVEALEREVPRLAERVVFMTGGAATDGAREYLAQSPRECLGKPFELEQLRALVRRRLPARV